MELYLNKWQLLEVGEIDFSVRIYQPVSLLLQRNYSFCRHNREVIRNPIPPISNSEYWVIESENSDGWFWTKNFDSLLFTLHQNKKKIYNVLSWIKLEVNQTPGFILFYFIFLSKSSSIITQYSVRLFFLANFRMQKRLRALICARTLGAKQQNGSCWPLLLNIKGQRGKSPLSARNLSSTTGLNISISRLFAVFFPVLSSLQWKHADALCQKLLREL